MPSPTIPGALLSGAPRIRTMGGQPSIEINGVAIPAESWTISHGYGGGGPVEVDVKFYAEQVQDQPEPAAADCCPAPEDDCSDCPPQSPPIPRVGETVHYVDYSLPLPGQRNDLACLPALVVRPPAPMAFEDGVEFNDGSTTLAVFNPLADDNSQYRDAKHESHPDSTGRWMTWHYADACQGAEDAPDADCYAVAPEANACAPEPAPAPAIHLLLSAPGDALVHDVDALIRKFAKKADAAGLRLNFA